MLIIDVFIDDGKIVTAVDQLKSMAQRKQYRETAQLLEVTTQRFGINMRQYTWIKTLTLDSLMNNIPIGCFAIDPVLPDVPKRQADRRVDRGGCKVAV
jgi:hypothetical protein